MKNTKTNVGSFAAAKLQAISRRLIAIIALIAVIGFSVAACTKKADGGGQAADGELTYGSGPQDSDAPLVPPAEQSSGTQQQQDPNDYTEILRGDLSEFAGTWVNENGTRIQLRADGTFSEGQEAENFEHGKDTLGFSEFYRWTATIDKSDPFAPRYSVFLLPVGVDFFIDGYTSDKTKVRLIRGTQDIVASSIFYREADDEAASASADFQINGAVLGRYNGNSRNVTIPSGVMEIGIQAFSQNRSIISVIIPAGVTTISAGAFLSCTSLTSVAIPTGVTFIGSGVFNGCTSLTSVSIPASVTFIDEHAFVNCTSLTSLTIPAGVTSIGGYAFNGWTSSQTIIVQGKANEAAADAAWGADWRDGCSAVIVYR